MIKIRDPQTSLQPSAQPTVQPYVSRETPKRWTTDDTTVIETACTTGKLPDGRIATQVRLALYLGFSRDTIVTKLAGRRLPLCNELMREGGRKSAYQRRVARVDAMRKKWDGR